MRPTLPDRLLFNVRSEGVTSAQQMDRWPFGRSKPFFVLIRFEDDRLTDMDLLNEAARLTRERSPGSSGNAPALLLCGASLLGRLQL
jgi:hypothetical protein